MPRMGEGSSGPSRSKLRAIWRRIKRQRDENAARVEVKRAVGVEPSGTLLDCVRMEEDWLAGRSTPVGIPHGSWRATCDELNAAEQAEADAITPGLGRSFVAVEDGGTGPARGLFS